MEGERMGGERVGEGWEDRRGGGRGGGRGEGWDGEGLEKKEMLMCLMFSRQAGLQPQDPVEVVYEVRGWRVGVVRW